MLIQIYARILIKTLGDPALQLNEGRDIDNAPKVGDQERIQNSMKPGPSPLLDPKAGLIKIMLIWKRMS